MQKHSLFFRVIDDFEDQELFSQTNFPMNLSISPHYQFCALVFSGQNLVLQLRNPQIVIEQDDGQQNIDMSRSSESSPLAFCEHDFTGRHTASLTPSPLPSVRLSPRFLMQAGVSPRHLNLQPPPTPTRRASPSPLGFPQYLNNPSTASSVRESPGEIVHNILITCSLPPPPSSLIVSAAITGFGVEKVAREIPIANTSYSCVLKRLQFDHSFVVHACVFNLWFSLSFTWANSDRTNLTHNYFVLDNGKNWLNHLQILTRILKFNF